MKKQVIAGIDEVGRGCLAGPVVSAAVVVKESIDLKNEGNILRELILKKIFNEYEKVYEVWGKEITTKNYNNNLSPFIKKLYTKEPNDILMLNQMITRVLHGYLQSFGDEDENISSNLWMQFPETKVLAKILEIDNIYIIDLNSDDILVYVNGMSKEKKTLDDIIKDVKNGEAIVIEYKNNNHYQSVTLKEGKPTKGGRKTLKNKHMYRKRNKTLKKIY